MPILTSMHSPSSYVLIEFLPPSVTFPITNNSKKVYSYGDGLIQRAVDHGGNLAQEKRRKKVSIERLFGFGEENERRGIKLG